MGGKQKYYVVWKGRKTGIFDSWEECKEQVNGFESAIYKSFKNKILAEEAFEKGVISHQSSVISETIHKKKISTLPDAGPILKSISVDASCIKNPGPMEYRGVYTETGEELFRKSFKYGTNNIGEFLAIVHALAYLKTCPLLAGRKNKNLPIYSDSENAISWIKDKKVKTKLNEDENTKELFEIIRRAEKWLQENNYENKILKWETQIWGDILADFGRK